MIDYMKEMPGHAGAESSIPPQEKHSLLVQSIGFLSIILAILNLWVLAQRFQSLLHAGRYFQTTGTENPSVYGIWKYIHGYPLYEIPNTGSYAAQLYNFLFYVLYGHILHLFRIDGADISVYGAILTFVFALV